MHDGILTFTQKCPCTFRVFKFEETLGQYLVLPPTVCDLDMSLMNDLDLGDQNW